GTGMNFDSRRAQRSSGLDLYRCCSNEERNTNTGMLKFTHDGSKLRTLCGRVEASFSCALCPLFRHQTNRVRPGLERDADHFFCRRHFEIERLVYFCLQPCNIVVTNMAAGFPQMSPDTIAARPPRKPCPPHQVQIGPSAP